MENEELINQFIGFIQTRLWTIIILFFLKDVAITFVKSITLRLSSTLSEGGLYKIDGVQGRLIKYGWFGLILHEKEGLTHKIPMSVAVRSIITDLDKLQKEA